MVGFAQKQVPPIVIVSVLYILAGNLILYPILSKKLKKMAATFKRTGKSHIFGTNDYTWNTPDLDASNAPFPGRSQNLAV